MLIKVCGNTQQSNMEQVASLSPNLMGFIYYPQSPRDISNVIQSLDFESIPKSIEKVLVTVDLPLDVLIQLIRFYKFDAVQLHGSESVDYCTAVRQHCKTIKAFKLWDALPSNLLADYEGKVDFFLLDTMGKQAGGNGCKFNHSILLGYSLKTPYFLAGGIDANDAEYLLSLKLPKCIGFDLNSRFETQPGVKNIETLQKFINQIQQ